MEVFEVAVEHIRLFAYPFARLGNIRLIMIASCSPGHSWVLVIFHRIKEVLLQPGGCIPIKSIDDVFTLRSEASAIIYVLLLNYFFRFVINFRLERVVRLFLLIFDP